jgi:hypothetical protein
MSDLPSSFKDSLAKCRFEQGTIIYKDKPIGGNWGEEIEHIDYLIQIQYPPSTMSSGSGDESVIQANWESVVEFERFYPKTKKKESIKTTQGRLFTFLWKDTPEVFNSSEKLLPLMFKLANKNINKNFIKNQIPENNIGFAFIYNPINDILRSKLYSIKEKALLNFKIEEFTFSVEEACVELNIKGTGEVYPLLSVKLLIFDSSNIEEINELIRSVVYKGTEGRFSINSHGLLIKK